MADHRNAVANHGVPRQITAITARRGRSPHRRGHQEIRLRRPTEIGWAQPRPAADDSRPKRRQPPGVSNTPGASGDRLKPPAGIGRGTIGSRSSFSTEIWSTPMERNASLAIGMASIRDPAKRMTGVPGKMPARARILLITDGGCRRWLARSSSTQSTWPRLTAPFYRCALHLMYRPEVPDDRTRANLPPEMGDAASDSGDPARRVEIGKSG